MLGNKKKQTLYQVYSHSALTSVWEQRSFCEYSYSIWRKLSRLSNRW